LGIRGRRIKLKIPKSPNPGQNLWLPEQQQILLEKKEAYEIITHAVG